MPEGMKAVFRCGEACGDLERVKAVLEDAGVREDASRRGGNARSSSFVLRAADLPLPKDVRNNRGQGYVALPGLGLRRPEGSPGVDPAAHLNNPGPKVDVCPLQAAQFGASHSGKDGRDEDRRHRPAAAASMARSSSFVGISTASPSFVSSWAARSRTGRAALWLAKPRLIASSSNEPRLVSSLRVRAREWVFRKPSANS